MNVEAGPATRILVWNGRSPVQLEYFNEFDGVNLWQALQQELR